MSFAMFKVMALELWRDRAALAMTFLLPSLVFVIFSVVFSGATGGDVKLRVAVADLVHTPNSQRLAAAMLADKDLRAEPATASSLAGVRDEVRSGRVDAGLVINSDPAAPGSPLTILADPSRALAAPVTQARTQQVMGEKLPDVLLTRTIRDISSATGPLTKDQQQDVSMAEQQVAQDPTSAPQVAPLFVQDDVAHARKGGGDIAYYAGAVTILFSLFSATHGALTLLDERRTGVADRILAGPAGMGPVVAGKCLFLVVQGAAQAVAIFATAQIVFAVPVAEHLGLWLVTTAAASIASGGLALGLVALCRSREQAQMLSTFVVLIFSAVGGSMIPRFLMPPWLQSVGWFTPHAWVIEAYQGLLWRDEGAGDLYKAWIVMTLIGAAGFALAQVAARRVRS